VDEPRLVEPRCAICDHDRVELVIIFGPPAVGKMTVGYELCKRTGYKLLHNHMTVEPLVEIFDFGSPPFVRLSAEFRRRIVEEAIEAGLPGLVLTFVWGLDLASDSELIRSYFDVVESRDSRVHLVELYADQEERLRRNGTEFRLDRKRSHRDQDFSRQILVELDRDYVLSSGGEKPTEGEALLQRLGHLRIDTTHLEASEAAAIITGDLGL
jgi:hypothetical protein